MKIPWSVEARPSTGLTNARLGVMLFLASETMLFGAMIASYVFLRTSAAEWPEVAGTVPGTGTAVPGTLLMLASSGSMLVARAAARRGSAGGTLGMLAVTMLAGAGFIGVVLGGFDTALSMGMHPSSSTAAGIWFVVTGLHALHVAGGLFVNLLLLGPWRPSRGGGVGPFVVRVDATGLYWHFLSVTWILTIAIWNV